MRRPSKPTKAELKHAADLAAYAAALGSDEHDAARRAAAQAEALEKAKGEAK